MNRIEKFYSGLPFVSGLFIDYSNRKYSKNILVILFFSFILHKKLQ